MNTMGQHIFKYAPLMLIAVLTACLVVGFQAIFAYLEHMREDSTMPQLSIISAKGDMSPVMSGEEEAHFSSAIPEDQLDAFRQIGIYHESSLHEDGNRAHVAFERLSIPLRSDESRSSADQPQVYSIAFKMDNWVDYGLHVCESPLSRGVTCEMNLISKNGETIPVQIEARTDSLAVWITSHSPADEAVAYGSRIFTSHPVELHVRPI